MFFLEKEPKLTSANPKDKFVNQSPKESETAKNELTTGIKIPGNQAEYWVIAGSFSQKENAQKRYFELINSGFKDTKVVPAHDKELYTILVQKTQSEFDANKIAQKLMVERQIKSFVKGVPNQ